MTTVVIYVPDDGNRDRHRNDCARFVEQGRLSVHAVTSDPATAARLVWTGHAEQVVVARPWHLADLTPPAFVVTEPADPVRPAQRRTRRRTRVDPDEAARAIAEAERYGPEPDPTRGRPEWTDPGTRRTSRRPRRLT